jgi:hypothetical protein
VQLTLAGVQVVKVMLVEAEHAEHCLWTFIPLQDVRAHGQHTCCLAYISLAPPNLLRLLVTLHVPGQELSRLQVAIKPSGSV